MVLELTEAEASQLARCLDVTVKAEGIQAAVAVVPLFNKLREAADRAKRPQAEIPVPIQTTAAERVGLD